ncbi:hypothetical protein HRW16_19680 [Streptomyces lunaelactis]|uniref:hypothetical protein n=1 Tax=Streptomyces lunaelactis TaxID=1535768 RepID=UPI001584C362|nr:hypothetical protein [Streptomyces lunaelactis]NUK94013.1 hypothetical protein [Streptomyces lunaelactis]
MSGNGMSPEALKRLRNLANFWNPRMEAATSDADLVKVVFDRAKAAAKRAQKNGDPQAMHKLAQELANWAASMERADATRQDRNAA